MPLTTTRAVLFDMDGVIVDNNHFHHAAWAECAREMLGVELAPADVAARFDGRLARDIATTLLGRVPRFDELLTVEAYKESSYRELARGRLAVVPGLADYLDELEARRIPVALVTSGGETNVAFVLRETGLEARFPVRVTGEEVKLGKPDPEPYLTAASRLGVDPRRCLVHEDAVSGVAAAVAAGARVAAVTTTQPAAALRAAGATWAVPDFRAWLDVVRSAPVLACV